MRTRALTFALWLWGLSLALPLYAGVVIVGFSPPSETASAESVVLQAIADAKKSLRVAAYSFTSKTIAGALVEAKNRGVDVQVVMDKSQRTGKYSSATFLANQGVPVRINSRYAIMHNKFIVVDEMSVQTGSFNYTLAAANRNAENVIYLKNTKELAKVYSNEWQKLWKESNAGAED